MCLKTRIIYTQVCTINFSFAVSFSWPNKFFVDKHTNEKSFIQIFGSFYRVISSLRFDQWFSNDLCLWIFGWKLNILVKIVISMIRKLHFERVDIYYTIIKRAILQFEKFNDNNNQLYFLLLIFSQFSFLRMNSMTRL